MSSICSVLSGARPIVIWSSKRSNVFWVPSWRVTISFGMSGKGRVRGLTRFVNQLGKLWKKVGGVLGSRRGFGMILHAENGCLLVCKAFDRAVVEVDVRHFDI